MEGIGHRFNSGILTLSLSGHVDSANSTAVEEEITRVRKETAPWKVVFDCEKLNYISSAGLRIILRVKKAVPDTELINVSADLYGVFEMTGFTEMMKIGKAFRMISVAGCEAIGSGANGTVYRIDPDTIVKVYMNPDALPEINRERELARTAFVLGIPTAIPYDVVRIEGGGYGSVFELLSARSFAQLLISGEKTVDEIAKMSADLLKIIHSTSVKPGSMPGMKDVALGWADFLRGYLPEKQSEKLCMLISAVPDDMHMLHGDFHIKNVMFQNGESLLIDMDTLCHGHPVFELASMFNAYVGYSETDHTVIRNFLGISHETGTELWKKTLGLYIGGSGAETVAEVEKMAMTVGYARIMRRSIRRGLAGTENGGAVVAHCREQLAELLSEVDTLVF